MGDNVYYDLGDDGVLTITGTGEMYDFNFYDSPLYQANNIKEVVIEYGITNIGSDAFRDCHYLKKVSIPTSVTEIGKLAFYRCTSLNYITIPNTIVQIGSGTFWDCESLEQIVLPESLVSLSDSMFDNCISLQSVILPSNIKEINEFAFARCSSLKNIDLPLEVSVISDYAFLESGIEEIIIPNGVTSIGNHAFSRCKSLDKIVIPASVTSIGGYAFHLIEYHATIYGYTGSTAETYAKENNIKFVALDGSSGENPSGDETGDDDQEGNLRMKLTPQQLTYNYSESDGGFTEESIDFSVNFSVFSSSLEETGEYASISEIDLVAPDGFSFDPDTEKSSTSLKLITPDVLEYWGKSEEYSFTLYAPSKEYIKEHPISKSYSDSLTISVIYRLKDGVADTIKKFDQEVYVKFKANGTTDPIEDGTRIISDNVDGDIVVNDGEYVVIKGNVSCNNLYVKGGTCKVGTYTDKNSKLTVKGNVEITGGKTNWLVPTDYTDRQGGTLTVYGELDVQGNMTVGTDCGILNQNVPESVIDVKRNFTITTNSTTHTCDLSDGVLKIGGSFKSSGKYSGNFQATENHLTLFYGNEFTIEMDKSKSYFNNLAFTEDAVSTNCKYGLDTLYTSNVKGKFFKYNDKSTSLNYLFKDYNSAVSTIVDTYKNYLDNTQFKKSMSGLKKYINDRDYFDKIVADIMMFCELENLAISTGESTSSIDLIGPWKNYFDSSDNLKNAMAVFDNGKTLLTFSNKNDPDVYICLVWLGASMGSTKNGSSSASCFFVRWIVDDNGKYYTSGNNLISLNYNDMDNITGKLVQVYKDSTKTNGNVGDFISGFKDYVLGSYKDLNKLYNGLTFQKDDLDFSKAKNICDLCNKIYKCINNKNLDAFIEIKDPSKSMKNVPEKITKFVESNMTASDIALLIACPVDVEIKNSAGNVVASVVNNKVVISSDEVSIDVINGDEKRCVFHTLDDFTISLSAYDNGTMDYYVYEKENGETTRTIAFEDLTLTGGKTFKGAINNYEKKESGYFALTDTNGTVYFADSDTDYSIYPNTNPNTQPNYTDNQSSSNNNISYVNIIPTYSFERIKLKGKISKNSVTLSWTDISDADKYTVYQLINGKYKAVKTTTENTITLKNLPTGKYKFKVRYTVGNRTSPLSKCNALNVSIKNIKPYPTVSVKNKTATLKWQSVDNAEKYAVYIIRNGKAIKLKETKKTSVKYKLKSGKEYRFAVRAYVDGKWTVIKTSDVIKVSAK